MGAAEAVQRVLLQRHVKEIIGAVHDDDTAAAGALLDEGDKKTAKLGDVPLGKVELRPAVPSVKIVDRQALLDWVETAHPDWLHVGPDVEPLKAALKRAHAWAGAQHGDVQMILDAATQHLHAQLRLWTGGLREGIERGLLDNVKANGGQRVDPESGECENVPGVEYDPGRPKAVVTIDRKQGGPEAVRAMLRGGSLPAITTGVES